VHRSPLAAAAGVLLAVLAGCGAPPAGAAAVPDRPVSAVPDGAVLDWRFDDPAHPPGPRGPAPAEVLTRDGGEVRPVRPGADGSGGAVAFPAVCSGEGCPHATITAPDSPELNPGARPFVLGASVLVRPEEVTTDHGSNLVQKGVSSTAQWKLQLDGGGDGRPSCVVRGAGGADRTVARSTAGVADGQWHHLTCRREGDELTVSVDGVVTGSAPVPEGLVIDPVGEPLAVGSKGPGTNNDQFHGTLDDVYFAVG
jgi:hypothetical protein